MNETGELRLRRSCGMDGKRMRLQGRVAVVTGGARGIGEGIARCLAEDGARVAILDLDGDEAARSAEGLGEEHLGITADVSDERTAAVAMEEAVRHCGRIDFLINNAGGGNRKASTAYGPPFTGVAQEGWDETMVLNLRTSFASTKTAIPYLKQRDQGVIVNIASIAGLLPSPTMPAYGAAKAAAISLTRTLALELAGDDIRVHAICPGGVDTDLVRDARPDLDPTVLMQPQEIADIVLFLVTRRGNGVIDLVNVRRATSTPWA